VWRIVTIIVAKDGKRYRMKNIIFIVVNVRAEKRIQYPPLYPRNNQSNALTFKKNNIKSNICILFPGGYVL